ncbi:MAG: serine/threonine protein kinase [Labilithrix sp.]|nr:serine/threonine protein kinase [Labilithrix sp.]
MSEVRFGPYRVVETLGSGALSTIYKAVQEPLGRVVALKALKTGISPTSSFGEQLDREAKILRDLAHPNVVLLLDRWSTGRPFLVLEHVDGPSVQQVLAKKRVLPVEAALAIAISVCSGLEHVHERGVVHRDVKPSNLLLSTTGAVKLIDFGIAQRARTTSVSDAFVTEGITPSGRMAPEPVKDAFGTPAYMSPEQILGDFVDGRSDLFSLGVVLYQMLSGSRPFETPGSSGGSSRPPPRDAKSTTQRIRRDAPPPLRDRAPHVPRGVDRIVMRLLEKAPRDRYASAGDVLERLSRELRALTREDPTAAVRALLVETKFITGEKRALDAAPRLHGGMNVVRALAGHAAVLVAFGIGVLAIESGSSARDGRSAGAAPLELVPEQAGGLRVLASPWAHVKVDGQQVETTPFARAIPLTAGKHFVTLMHPDAPPVERDVVIAPNEIVTLDVTMMIGGDDAGVDAAPSARGRER